MGTGYVSRWCRVEGQGECHGGPMIISHADDTAVRGGDRLHDRQAEAGPPSGARRWSETEERMG